MIDQMRDDLQHALERQELVVYYQPKLNLENNKICGAEALIRWQHPKYGWISPEDFIPLAEDSGLILDIGHWILDKACQSCAVWHAAGFRDTHVAVNFSAPQFEDKAFYQYVVDTLNKNNVLAEQLEIELTEGLILTHNKDIERMIKELKGIGIKFAMDDFGTGYSSLSNLIQFPIDTIKIDKSFLEDISTNKVNQVIIQSVISLAHNLQKTVVAEGVETEDQLAFLKDNYCDLIQGRYISMPISGKDFLAFIKNH